MERDVQVSEGEGTSGAEGTSREPGTEANQPITREELEQIMAKVGDDLTRKFQGVTDTQVARVIREERQRISEERATREDDDLFEEALPGYGGYFQQAQQPQQQPDMRWDPATQQWYPIQSQGSESWPYPQARQRAAAERRRLQKIREQGQETAQVVQQERFISQTLAEAGMTRADINPYDYSREGFVAEIQRRTSAKAKATQEAVIQAEVEKRLAEAKQGLLQQDIDRGSYDQFQGGPAAVPPSGGKLERTVALNEAFNMGKIDGPTFEKLRREIENE